MDILISGGAGFIGSNFIRYMLSKYPDYRIVNVDKLTYAGNLKNLEDIEKDERYRFYQVDIANHDALLEVFKNWYGFDVIVNFAAESHVDRSILEYSKEFIDSNIVGTFNFLEIIKKYKVKKYLQVSTDEVYGSLEQNGKFTEKSYLKPSSLYSATKTSADLIALSYYHTFKIPVIVSRCSNNYGSFQYPEKLIPLMITNIIEGKKLPVYGKGLNIRDWIHVLDHCRALDTLLHYGKIGECYNVGGGNEWQNIEIVKFIIDYLGANYDMIEFVRDRLGHDYRYAMDYSKMNTEFGWKPLVSFADGLRDTIEWYQKNTDWWQPLKK